MHRICPTQPMTAAPTQEEKREFIDRLCQTAFKVTLPTKQTHSRKTEKLDNLTQTMESITTTPVDVTVSRRAYAKMILHAAKYPHCAVSGLLLAPAKSANGSSKLSLSDAVPLFHQIQGLSPMVEVALAQVDILAQSAQMVVAGYYHANEGYSDQSVDVFSQRVADAVAAHSVSTSALVTIDNRKLGLDGANHALVVQVRGCVEGGKWRKTEEVVVEEGALETASALLQKKVDVVDFDNHLDDLSVDFLNVEVNLEVDRCCN